MPFSRVMFLTVREKALIFSRASSCDVACVGNLGQQEATASLSACAAGAFGNLAQPVPRGRPWGKASCDRHKPFQRIGTGNHILLPVLAHLLKWLPELLLVHFPIAVLCREPLIYFQQS